MVELSPLVRKYVVVHLASWIVARNLPASLMPPPRLFFISVPRAVPHRYALYTYLGSDPPDVTETGGRSQDNVYDSNTIMGGPQAIKFKESDGSVVTGNTFSDPGTVEWSNSTRNVVTDNIGLADADEFKINEPACFDETDEKALAEYECEE